MMIKIYMIRLFFLTLIIISNQSIYAQNQFKVEYSIIKVDTMLVSEKAGGTLNSQTLNLYSLDQGTIIVFNTNKNGDISLYNKTTGISFKFTALGSAEKKLIETSQGQIECSVLRTLDDYGNEVLVTHSSFFTGFMYLKTKKILTFTDK